VCGGGDVPEGHAEAVSERRKPWVIISYKTKKHNVQFHRD